MILAGPCLMDRDEPVIQNVFETARQLKALNNDDIVFRCKIWGGGPDVKRFCWGIGDCGTEILKQIQDEIGIRCATEVRTYRETVLCVNAGLKVLWIGARNMQNYSLYKEIENILPKDTTLIIKRNMGATVSEAVGIIDVVREKMGIENVILCERGIVNFDRHEHERWRPDFMGLIEILHTRPDIPLMLDVSHSTFNAGFIAPVISAAKKIGVKNFMIEAYADPNLAITDKRHAVGIDYLGYF